MTNSDLEMRASGEYATVGGVEYFAERIRDHVWLYTNDDPLPSGFEGATYTWVRGEKSVPLSSVQRLTSVQTTCIWQGHSFGVGIIVGDMANVVYLGKHFDDVSGLPGLSRPDKYDVRGKVPVSELTEVREHVQEVPLPKSTNETASTAE